MFNPEDNEWSGKFYFMPRFMAESEGVNIKWASVPNTTGYEVGYVDEVKEINSPSFRAALDPFYGKELSITVRAVGVNNGEKVCSNWYIFSFENPFES